MKFRRLISFSLFAAILPAGIAAGGDTADSMKPNIRAARIEGGINMSGRLDDPAWSSAQPIEINYEVTPGDNTPAPQRTMVKILYDASTVYFGFDCKDTRAQEIR